MSMNEPNPTGGLVPPQPQPIMPGQSPMGMVPQGPPPPPPDPMEEIYNLIANVAMRSDLNVDVQAKSILEMAHGFFFLASGKESLAQANLLGVQAQNQPQSPDPQAQHALNVQDQQHAQALKEAELQHTLALRTDQQNHQHTLDKQNQDHQHQLDVAKLQMQQQAQQQAAQQQQDQGAPPSNQ